MTDGSSPRALQRPLPIILAAAVVQGWALYGLHHSLDEKQWPATSPGWLFGLYATVVLIPLTLQMLARFAARTSTWVILGSMTAVYFYFGWHYGVHVAAIDARDRWFNDQFFALGFVLGILWLLMLPFIQARSVHGVWRVSYAALFSVAWNNKLVLFEAALFTGLFWILLLVWQQLFSMLGIGFFRELFKEPIFFYPVTAIAFGIALHLIGSLERLSAVVLEQLLNVLKWLAIVAGIILVLFTVALALKLPGMIASGNRAIGAAWLLWLVAIMVLLVNAAYRDGSVSEPYPRPIALALRFVIPLTVVSSLTAVYALYLRIDGYGFTVSRVWACVVAAAACVYSIGYALAARDRPRWMHGIARVNVIAALFLIAVLALALTPVLSPSRLAAQSQFAQVLDHWAEFEQQGRREHPLNYLRFSAGNYGVERLRQLAKLQGHPQAAEIRAEAAAELARKWPGEREPADPATMLAALIVHPANRVLEADLRSVLLERLEPYAQRSNAPTPPVLGVFMDMDGNGTEEFVLVLGASADVFEKHDSWTLEGRLQSLYSAEPAQAAAVAEGAIRVVVPQWHNLQIGQQTFRETLLVR